MGEAVQSSGLVCGPWYDLMNTYGAGLPSGRGAEEDQSAYGLNGAINLRHFSTLSRMPYRPADQY